MFQEVGAEWRKWSVIKKSRTWVFSLESLHRVTRWGSQRLTFSSWEEQICSWAHFMGVILSAVTVHLCDPGFQQNKAGSVVVVGDTPKPMQQGSLSLLPQWWELSRSVMALAAAAILLFVFQSACCSGRPPLRIQIALFTAGRRVMARMSDGNVFCCDRRGQEKSIAQLYPALCSISR